ncbi:MAG: hypothetical protein KAJ29_06935 [Alphaproteobacteria bacterium]|nr:hypothetical protein [Alphaproteobacteria bacterium]
MSRNEDQIHIIQEHFGVLKESIIGLGDYNQSDGIIPSTFGYLVDDATSLPQNSVSRGDLFQMSADKKIKIDVLCLSVFAWGGIHKNNLNYAFNLRDRWFPVAEKIRAGLYNRADAYAEFCQLRKDKHLKGVGPAYFTKLIYFLMPDQKDKPRGYIMDQWVSCSVNILAGRNLVFLDAAYKWKGNDNCSSNFTVSDVNTHHDYEAYCQYIEKLAVRIKRSPDETEFCLMSEGGKKKKTWRDHVINNRRLYEQE